MRYLELPQVIVYGIDSIDSLGGEVKKLGTKPLIVCGKTSAKKSGAIDRAINSLSKQGITPEVFDKVNPEPEVGDVEMGVEIAKSFGADVIIGIGGGSPMDVAKGIAVCLKIGKPITALKGEEIKESLPVVNIPTTAGTGSEVTRFAVFTDPTIKEKFVVRGPGIVPKVAIIDPSLTYSMPPNVAASSGIDALSHAIESYMSNRSTLTTDMLAISAIDFINKYLEESVNTGNPSAREKIAYASFWAGMSFNNSSVVLVHAMSRPLGAFFHIPHGVSNGILLPYIVRFNASNIGDKLDTLRKILGKDPWDRIWELLERINLPTKISQVVKEEIDFAPLVEQVLNNASTFNNPRPVSREDVFRLYKEAL
ncbi:MAG: iron-containing alcohol dehydrogenase family protein [bacterium]